MADKPEFVIPPDLSTSTKKKKSGTRKATLSESAQAQYQQALISTYMSLWGAAPPPGYIESVSRKGWNLFELETHERAKPAFKYSPRYLEEQTQGRLGLAQRLGNPI